MKIGFLSILTLIFITLKLMNIITWSWWLVLLPLYGVALFMLIMSIISFIIYSVLTRKKRK